MSLFRSFSFALVALLLSALTVQAAPPVVSNVRAAQRAGTGLVDIYYDLESASNVLTVSVAVSTNSSVAFNVAATSVSGDLGGSVTPGTGKHIVWNAGADLATLYFPNVKVRVMADDNSLNTGLVTYFPFNGNANDASGNGNNGTVYNATLTTNRFGVADSAYDFNGSNSYIDVPQDSVLNNLTTNFTLSVWIYQRSAQPNGYRIVDKCPAGLPDGWTFDTCDNNTGRRVRIQGAANNSLNVVGSTEYSLMTWHFVVATVSGNVGSVYLDGNLDGTGNVGNIPANALDIFIGRAHPNNGSGTVEWFDGIIDDVRIYNRPLSASEVQQLYNN